MALRLENTSIQSTGNLSLRSNASATDDVNFLQTAQGGVTRLVTGRAFLANWTGPGGDSTSFNPPPLGTVFRNPVTGNTYIKVSGGAWSSGGNPSFLCGTVLQAYSGAVAGFLPNQPYGFIYESSNATILIGNDTTSGIRYRFNGVEIMRQVETQWLIGTSSAVYVTPLPLLVQGQKSPNYVAMTLQLGGSSAVTRYPVVTFFNNSNGTYSQQGRIEINNSSTQLVSTSDYRFKTQVQTMTHVRGMIDALKPRRFRRNDIPDSPMIEGFIAHELGEVLPRAVVGGRDSVDEDGRPRYQTIDARKVIPLLTAGLQQVRRELAEIKTQIQRG